MKEHSFPQELGFTPRDSNYKRQADMYCKEFDDLLWNVISLSDWVVSTDVPNSGEVFTEYKMDAEMVSAYLPEVQPGQRMILELLMVR